MCVCVYMYMDVYVYIRTYIALLFMYTVCVCTHNTFTHNTFLLCRSSCPAISVLDMMFDLFFFLILVN